MQNTTGKSEQAGVAAGRWGCGELRTVLCDGCGSDHARPICTRPDGLTVVECRRCGLAFLNPRPEDHAVWRLYDSEYFIKRGAPGTKIGYLHYREPLNLMGRYPQLNLLERFLPLRGARLLEVGCATGSLLAEAHRRGATVVGLDVSEYAVALAQRNTGLDVRAGTLESSAGSLGTFDAALAFEVIEHVVSPRSFLTQLASLVRPGGLAMLSTPNYRCARRFGSAWLGFQTSFEHLYFFSDDVLARMAWEQGLEEVCWYTTGSGESSDANRGVRAGVKALIKRLPGFNALHNLLTTLSFPAPVYYGQGHCVTALFRRRP